MKLYQITWLDSKYPSQNVNYVYGSTKIEARGFIIREALANGNPVKKFIEVKEVEQAA